MASPHPGAYANTPALRGALMALSPVPLLLLARFQPRVMGLTSTRDLAWFGGALATCAALAGAAWMLARLPRLARLMAATGVVGAGSLAMGGLTGSPGSALAMLLICGTFLALIFPGPARPIAPTLPPAQRAARGAAWAGLGVWVFGLLGSHPGHGFWPAVAVMVLAAGFGLHWLVRCAPARARMRWFIGSIALAALGVVATRGHSTGMLAALGLIPISLLWNTRHFDLEDDPALDLLEMVLADPARAIVATFLLLVLAGGTVLSLPASGVTADAVPGIDAFFVATSAACVTGLSTLDVSSQLSGLGLVTLLLLIQVGGLGIMTFSTAALTALGAGLGMRYETTAAGLLGLGSRHGLVASLRTVLAVTFISELIGAAALTLTFHQHGDGWPMALWRGVFHAVSAFCNAGFALQGDNLGAYHDDPVVLHLIGALTVVGGLGPAVVVGLPALLRRDVGSLQIRIVVFVTAVLLAVPTALIAALEWNNALAGLSGWDRLHNAWFQSLSLRTAGFSSVSLESLHPATIVVLCAVMFIGGGPGSTAGGVKVTTFAILVLGVIAAMRGRDYVEVFGRRLPHNMMYKAAAIATMGVISVLGGFLALLVTQDMPFEVALFETISALGTVGLSLGGTGLLDAVGKLIVMGCMFAGRVGPLTLFILLSDLQAEAPSGYPTEDLSVG